MVKKCIIENDELGKPIKLIEVKEFTDAKSFKDFEKLCEENAEAAKERRINAEQKAAEEKKAFEKRIDKLEKDNDFLFQAIEKILGVGSREEIEAILKEVNNNE